MEPESLVIARQQQQEAFDIVIHDDETPDVRGGQVA
jgi:hypothetical protein